MRLILLLILIGHITAQDLGKFFDEYNVKGSFMIYDLSKDSYEYFDSARCYNQFTPASTFKIPNSIIGLETGVITDENFVIPWDSVVRQVEAWNLDMDLKTAFQVSCVPYYQELARRVGEEKMQEMVNKFNYGNKNISCGIDKFWLNGELRISQTEQINFLRKLYKDELPVSKRSIEITKNIMLLEDTLGYKLRAKTGWGGQDSKDIGWLVGWVEKENNVSFFALNIESNNPQENFGPARREITKKLLKELGII
ncbi:MAG TPA: class D beta-lactamase [Ignavibacteria bacterium]|jgi:beta-lactamase class D